MFRTLSTIVALSVWMPTYAADESIVGSFESKMGKPGNSLELRINCESESSCTLTSIVQWRNDPPQQEQQALTKVQPVEDLTEARRALQYAIGQRARSIKNEEFAETMDRLRPVLAANPVIAKCWDLNDPAPQYMLACTFSNVPPGSPSLYLFGTLIADCGEAFCRYVIHPMDRVR